MKMNEFDSSNDLFQDYYEISRLDFNDDKQKLVISYLIRLVSLPLFYYFFAIYATFTNPPLNFTFNTFLSIGIKSVPSLLSVVLLILDLILVLYLHELIHALVFYLTKGALPKIGIKGFIIYAAAPGLLNRRNGMVINALAPFVVISIIGLIFIPIINQNYLAWIFIPIVINAAAAGGDFMTVWWLLKNPKNTLFEDNGDLITAYKKS